MTSAIFKIAKTDFLAFARMALRELDGTRMSDDRYLELLASELMSCSQANLSILRTAKPNAC
jgi:hypothetical protein